MKVKVIEFWFQKNQQLQNRTNRIACPVLVFLEKDAA